MKTFNGLAMLQAALRIASEIPAFEHFPKEQRDSIARTVRNAPLFTLDATLPKAAIDPQRLLPALTSIWETRPEPACYLLDYDGVSALGAMEFLAFDGLNLFFLGFKGSAALTKPYWFDLEFLSVRDLYGELTTERMDADSYSALALWCYAEAYRWSPDAGDIIRVPAGSTVSGGKRVAIPASTTIRLPSDMAVLYEAAAHATSNRQEALKMNHVFERVREGQQTGYMAACTRCRNTEFLPASGFKGSLPQTVIAKKFKQKGWSLGKKCLCPTCINPPKIEAKVIEMKSAPTLPKVPPMPQEMPVAIDAPRQMTAADKRKVFRAIDENWDETKSRYLGAASDSHLAQTLNVPRAWVTEVREENFGKTQRNEDLDKIAGDLKNLRAEAARSIASALDLATKFEQLEQKYIDLIRRVESVE